MKNAEGVTNRRQNLQGHKKHLLKKSPSSAYHKQQATAFDNSWVSIPATEKPTNGED